MATWKRIWYSPYNERHWSLFYLRHLAFSPQTKRSFIPDSLKFGREASEEYASVRQQELHDAVAKSWIIGNPTFSILRKEVLWKKRASYYS